MQKLHSLTGIRAIAALGVILFHMLDIYNYGPLQPLVLKGHLGVDLFFVLSGFILSFVHQSDFNLLSLREVLRFYLLRLARILPVHYFVLLYYLLFYGALALVTHQPFHHYLGDMRDFTLNICNIHAWGFCTMLNWNCPSWSVSAEWFAYLSFPFLCLIFLRFQSRFSNLFIFFSCFIVLTFCCILKGTTGIGWTFDGGLLRIVTEFPAGCALYNLYKLGKPPQWLLPACIIGSILGAYLNFPEYTLALMLAGLIYGLTETQGFLASRPMVHLGEISYSVYMVHSFICGKFEGLDKHFGIVTPLLSIQNVIFFLLIIGTILLVGEAVYRYVEVPCRNTIRKLISGLKQKQPSLLG